MTLPRVRGRLLLLALLPLAAVAALALWRPAAGGGQESAAAVVAQPDASMPAGLVLFGSSPAEQQGETWGFLPGGAADGWVARRSGGVWERFPAPVAADGGALSDVTYVNSPQTARATAGGGLALLGSARAATDSGRQPQLFTRDPGGPLRAAPSPGDVVVGGESPRGALTAFAEPSGATGVFVAAAVAPPAISDGIFHFDGAAWRREQVCLDDARPCAKPSSGFAVIAVGATAPTNAWALAVPTTRATDGIVLLRRDTSGSEPIWRLQSLGGSPFAERSPVLSPDLRLTISPRQVGQPLSVTDGGVWVDARVAVDGASSTDATFLFVPDGAGGGSVTGAWCDLPAALSALCDHPLGVDLGSGRSFVWSGEGQFGTRVVTGLAGGAVLTLRGDRFVRVPTVGGTVGTAYGAAFVSPSDGWLGPGVRLSTTPEPDRVQPWPVPFRRPLTAVVAAPGAAPGDLGAAALAVGDRGQIARYTPGHGWDPEFLIGDSGARATPRLRGVAWPTADRAHAVGDDAEMWVWRRQTGLWEPDPAKPPNLVLVNFTGIAFDPADSERGYAIGKQGLLLRYGRQWTQQPLPSGVDPRVNLTSVAFAGRQALVTYRMPTNVGGSSRQAGGLMVDDGGGWHVDESLAAVLPAGEEGVPERVAALPDGGAAVASLDGTVVTRDSAGAPWQRTPGGAFGYPIALAAVREAGQVRAVMSAGSITDLGIDDEQVFTPPADDQPPLVTAPYRLPVGGSLLRLTSDGWRDERHLDFPDSFPSTSGLIDRSLRPDAVLALLLSADGTKGWAVGGETGQDSQFQPDAVQTAAIMRYPAEASAPLGAAVAPVASGAAATFAIGGNAVCARACADLANVRVGPDVWLPAAVRQAAGIGGVRAFLSTGPGVAAGLASSLGAGDFAREQEHAAQRLQAGAGVLPVFAAPSAGDRDRAGSLDTFRAAYTSFGAPLGSGAAGAGITPAASDSSGSGGYAFDSAGAGGSVRVIMLDMSQAAVGEPQRCWLAQRLSEAATNRTPAIVVGQRDLAAAQGAGNATSDTAAMIATLVLGQAPADCALPGAVAGASAYFFDYPEQNRTYPITLGGRSIPTFGSGTLGYVAPPTFRDTDRVDASGFLLASVDVSARNPSTNVAPVTARLIPAIDQLALDARDGTLLRRSQVALFSGLARRPLAGMRCRVGGPGSCAQLEPDPYVEIPADCQGARCASGLLPEYRFSSSRPDIANFVRQDPASANPRHVLLDANSRPVADASSGLLCAFNAGTTVVRIEAGGLAYEQTLTVQRGSVRQPCGTVRLTDPPQPPEPAIVPGQPDPGPQPARDPTPSDPAPTPVPPPPLPPAAIIPARVVAPAPAPRAAPSIPRPPSEPPPFSPDPPGGLTRVPPAVPPPAPQVARPIPPTGAAPVPVVNPAVSPQREREEEEAIEQVHNSSAYRGEDPFATVRALPFLILLLALGAGTVRGARRRRDPAFASTTPSIRPQRFRR